MKFGPVPIQDAVGAILAHTVRLPGGVMRKGVILATADVAALHRAGIDSVIVARLDPGDVHEDRAAQEVCRAAAGEGVRADPPTAGRSNLVAETTGIVLVNGPAIDGANQVDEAITISTLRPHAFVRCGQLVGTVKVIPFAAPEEVVDACVRKLRAGGPPLAVQPLRARRAGLVLTRLPGTPEDTLERASATMKARLERLGSTVADEVRCDHTPDAVAGALRLLASGEFSPLLILGASATVDRADVIPTAIEAAGGHVVRFGMPVDPGNLLLLAELGRTPVVVAPGCARSLRPSGFDEVLERVLADRTPAPGDLQAMGVGGLLTEIHDRPHPRVRPHPRRAAPTAAAVVLAAGRSARMGSLNKLLLDVAGSPMVLRVVDAVLAPARGNVTVVTGHDRSAVESALSGRHVRFVHNPVWAAGLGTSIGQGIASLDPAVEAALICLGDMPWIRPEHVEALLEAFDPGAGRSICVPTYRGKRGHPVLWGARFFPQLGSLEGDSGARALMTSHEDEVWEVPVPDEGVLMDIDTTEALALLVKPGQAKGSSRP